MDESALIRKIEDAFQNIPRGNIGIRQASAIDSRLNPGDLYEDKARFEKMRSEDVEADWRQIPESVLDNDPAVFSHLDPAGFRFVLPAIMRWSLRDNYSDEWDVLGYLLLKILNPKSNPAQLADLWSLSKDQIQVVIEWIETVVAFGRYEAMPEDQSSLEEWKKLIDHSVK